MLYIHRTTCISPQQTFGEIDIQNLKSSVDNKLHAAEPKYDQIPPGLLRRMGKAVRIGVGAALPLIKQGNAPDGIIIGTANGGMEDCIKFLNQIIEYNEGMLTPGNFVQSTANAIASQISMMTSNKSYNITHVHRGLAFENAIIDALMLVRENASHRYLLGGVDEISAYNYNIDYLDGWYKKEPVTNNELYNTDSPASIAGEGSAMFLVSASAKNAIARLSALHTIHGDDENFVRKQLENFIAVNIQHDEKIDLFISGENGDNRLKKIYSICENVAGDEVTIARFKHMSGEFPTASGFALWLACNLIQDPQLPMHMIKRLSDSKNVFRKILVYNNYKGMQHSFMLVSAV